MKHLSTHNTKGFFDGLKVGELFTFLRRRYSLDQVKRLAAKAGLNVEEIAGQNSGELARGRWRCKVISKETRQTKMQFEPAKPKFKKHSYSPKDAIAAAEKIIGLKLNQARAEYRGPFVVELLIKGTLLKFVEQEFNRLTHDGDFEHYYGASIDTIFALADVLENVEDDPDRKKAIAAVIHAHSLMHGPAFRNNFQQLEKHGLLRVMNDFSTDFRGLVFDVTKVSMAHGMVEIIHCRDGESERFYDANNTHLSHRTFEMAFMSAAFGEFGKAAHALYRSVPR